MSLRSLEESLDLRRYINAAKEGKLIEIFRGSKEIRDKLGSIEQVTFHFLNSGEVGGNHFHRKKYEIIYVCSGELRVFLKDPRTQELYSKTVYSGEKFDLKPGIAHALYNPSEKDSSFIEFSNLAFNPENPRNDVYACEIISRKVSNALIPNQNP